MFKRNQHRTAAVTAVAARADAARAQVEDNPAHSRFDLWVDGELVGILGYRRLDGVDCAPADGAAVALMHTVVKEEHGGRGWAAVLVREVLEEARVRGWRVHPVCTYVRRYLGTHTEYLPLLDDA
ncbi:GNAT family N-acetyltransferase [Rhodococcus sp. NPDC058505]|uniref:GNAT family N-acetyltransferase n=1 Tax=unclassified Rhodococcus (in: high G+C Gram-positive bacteria) TaxID=192944 RepID=UPI0036656E6F